MKLNKSSIFAALCITILGVSIAFSSKLKTDTMTFWKKNGDDDKYKKYWKKVDSLDSKGLPNSALEVVNTIYDLAKDEQKHDQFIKAVAHRLRYNMRVDEKTFDTQIVEMGKEINKAVFPNTAIMKSMLAEMYWMYYQNNVWEFRDRTQTVNFDNDDIATWDLKTLVNKVILLYNESLYHEDDLKKIALSEYAEIIVQGTASEKIRPTLYDFLAHRAIDFFSDSRVTLESPAEQFSLNEDFYFDLPENIAAKKIATKDTLSLHFHAVRLYQKLFDFRSNDDNQIATIDLYLKWSNFINAHSTHPDKESKYYELLNKLVERFEGKHVDVALFKLGVANYFNTYSSRFSAHNPATKKYKDYKIKAIKQCQDIVEKNSMSMAVTGAKSLIAVIESRDLSFNVKEYNVPNKTVPVKINYRNIDKVFVRLATISDKDYNKIYDRHYNGKYNDKRDLLFYNDIKKTAISVMESSYNVPIDADYNAHSFEIPIKSEATGKYVLFVSEDDKFTYKMKYSSYDFLEFTNLSCITRRNNGGEGEVIVFNRNSSSPIEGAKVEAYYREYNYKLGKYKKNKIGVFTTNREGIATIKTSNKDMVDISLSITKDADVLEVNNSIYIGTYDDTEYDNYTTTLFTDRAIYRPGQTVYFKGILLLKENKSHRIVTNEQIGITLYDVNYQVVKAENLTTNEYGTFSGTFEIPTGLLNGRMELRTSYGSKFIRVEEYKRPKFEAKMLPFDGNYKLNDSVSVKGEAIAYSGAKITEAQVKYKVTRTPKWFGWWSWYFDAKEVVMQNGVAETDEQGQFAINFKALPDPEYAYNKDMAFNYKITIDVTDINGETQSTSGNITVGNIGLQAAIGLPSRIDRKAIESHEYSINTKNLNGAFIPAQGEIIFYKLEDNKTLLRNRDWERPDKFVLNKEQWDKQVGAYVYNNELDITSLPKGKVMLKQNFDTKVSKKILPKINDSWSEGYYVAELVTKDVFGNKIESKHFFTLFDGSTKQMPTKEAFWLEDVKTTAEPGETAQFIVGTAHSNANILFEVEHQGTVIKKQWLKLNNEKVVVDVPVEEKHRGNLTAYFTLVIDNQSFLQTKNIDVPFSNKELEMEFATFRDKLQPGENDEWRITIKGKKGEKVAAEMMATLYDASLDAFAINSWNFNYLQYNRSTLSWSTSNWENSSSKAATDIYRSYYNQRSLSYAYLNWFGLSYNYYSRYYRNQNMVMDELTVASSPGMSKDDRKRKSRKKMMAMDDVVGNAEFAAEDMEMAKEEEETVNPSVTEESPDLDMGEVKVRTNFNETAFFMPHLQTDEQGNIIVKFTIPESLTRWKMMGFAHTKDLKYGFLNNELVTQKELMAVPNAPRFFREGDEIEFPVKLTNLSERELKGKVQLELFDALTMKPLSDKFKEFKSLEVQDFSIAKGMNTMVSWKLKIPEGASAITYRVKAKADNFSDGEEKPIPVLTNRMLVTESLPLPVRGKGKTEFEFTKLLKNKSKTLKHHKLTLEFTSNPAWYAVQALPYLMEYPYECTEQTFSRFYANSIATGVANSSPKIKAVFEAWKNTEGSQALLSNLDKNQELKSLILEETPWVMNAQNESARKKRIALLFDLHRMAGEQEKALKKILKAQTYNGGWPWFPGMPESRYITQHIACGMGHLDRLGIKSIREDRKIWKMVSSAVAFLDGKISDDYQQLRRGYTEKELKLNHLSQNAVHYLYMRSFFNELKLSKKAQEALDYYQSQAQQYWLSQGLYSQGMIALALHRNDKRKIATDIVKSLKENSQNNEEMGMYWKQNVGGWYWYEAPIETQALMIEVFAEVTEDQQAVNDMKVWLLKQKQTQDWKTTKATTEAVYALLLQGDNWLENTEMAEITLGDIKVDPTKMKDVAVEAGTGYFKTSWSGDEVSSKMGKVTVVNNHDGVAWGAVYWQYFEQLDKITPHKTPLSLSKKIFVERETASGKLIDAVNNKSEVKVGDKIIVRIELRVDRAMEYVHMKDMRASGFEPINVISSYKYQDGLGYYESTKDAATNFFISYLPKGTYVFEYPLRVSHKGDFSNGITTIQCMYAPEFTSHSEGIRVTVK